MERNFLSKVEISKTNHLNTPSSKWQWLSSFFPPEKKNEVKYFLMAEINTKALVFLLSTINVNISEHLKQLGSYSIY